MEKSGELYVIIGIGRDVTGLVSLITSIISDVNGNIIDVEERVFHGLFSILLTVDLSNAKIPGPQFIAKMQAVAHQSGLHILAERHRLPRLVRGKRMSRLVLIGPDHPGIVSSATFVLANNGINIERACMISRGDLFAMEMELDRSGAASPMEDIERNIAAEMKKFGIHCFFQNEDIYHKRKLLLVVNSNRNILDLELCADLYARAGRAGSKGEGSEDLAGIRLKAMEEIAGSVELGSETEYLLHTLKLMGFRICVIVPGLDLMLDPLRQHVGIDYIFSNHPASRGGSLTGEVEERVSNRSQRKNIIGKIMAQEGLTDSDVIRVGDSEPVDIALDDCGIRLVLDKEKIDSLLEAKEIRPEQIPAILSAFGVWRVRT